MTYNKNITPRITILGIGNILFSDDGFGIRVIQKLLQLYEFPYNVKIVDGGTLGINLIGTISGTDYLIIVDTIKNNQKPGHLYCFKNDQIPEKKTCKNSIHQIDLLETLTMFKAIDKVSQIIMFGVEPKDTQTLRIKLTDQIYDQVDNIINMILSELQSIGVSYQKRKDKSVPCDPIQDY